MTFNEFASLIAKREGKKSQASIGDIREILKILIQMELEYQTKPDYLTDPSDSPLEFLMNEVMKRRKK